MKKLLALSLTLGFCGQIIGFPAFAFTPQQSEQQFIQQFSKKYHTKQSELQALFKKLQENKSLIVKMTAPFEKKPWSFYRHFFITDARIQGGALYLKKHHAMLLRMQKKYGVLPSIMTAIIGIETAYGENTGTYPVLNTLYTLAFYYPPRSTFFKNELSQYLLLVRDNHFPILSLKGSYAGALGIPQFMPSSYRYYGVAMHGEKSVDLFHNNNDAIASVANYFHHMGWKENQPIARRLTSKNAPLEKTERRIALAGEKHYEYWAVAHNFDVIMRYNHNVVYAMAVYQLSRAIENAYANKNTHKS